eukprot:FR736982.1.p1 GENE.FR736982.1~~FR736982.1.p1  ORF type:complete len:113 (+),score=6.53 FR736982.1:173-511(+)
MFHGKGTLTFENGVYEATWKDGKEETGQFIFDDGLPFTKKTGIIALRKTDDSGPSTKTGSNLPARPAAQPVGTNQSCRKAVSTWAMDITTLPRIWSTSTAQARNCASQTTRN